MQISTNELDSYFMVSFVISAIFAIVSIAAFLVGIFYDLIAMNFTLQHQSGIGTHQIIWISFWGLMILAISGYVKMTWKYMEYYGR